MKICFISDTHGQHSRLTIPECDLLIHCGDLGMRGSESDTINFIHWFNSLPIKHKVFIAGNHDFHLEQVKDQWVRDLLEPGVYYLNDSGVVIEGLKIWGSPVQPWFYDWAFNRQRGADIKKHWDLIPDGTDILVTHGPPSGILDKTVRGEGVGCADLYNRVYEVCPTVHAFGHIHEGYGKLYQEGTTYINCSVLNQNYHLVNSPIVYGN